MKHTEVIIIGGGLAGLSAAVYLGRARRDAIVLDEGKSMARWEPDVQNYLGFPDGVQGAELVKRGRQQARRYGIRTVHERIEKVSRADGQFLLHGTATFSCERLLLATGIFHVPPNLPGLKSCLGHSMFFCRDCDGYRVQGENIAVYGWTNHAIDYALAMVKFSPCVAVVTDGHKPQWDAQHTRWVTEYELPVHQETILNVRHRRGMLEALCLTSDLEVEVSALFTVRGDIYFNELAKSLGAKLDSNGEVLVDVDMRTSVPGLYAAGCVTPANCQMIIAAGQGAVAAQAINQDLFRAELGNHRLRRYRGHQLRNSRTRPAVKRRRVTMEEAPVSG